MQAHTSCAILAGGKGTRLGCVAKGLIRIGSQTIAERLVNLATAACREVFVIANEPHLYRFPGVTTIPDDQPHQGPLEGIATALRRIQGERLLVMACDMPLIDAESVRTLVDWPLGADAVVPQSEKGPEPLFALYARRTLPRIEGHLSVGERRIRSIFSELDVESPPPGLFKPQTWYNINEATHLDELARAVGQMPHLPDGLEKGTDGD